MLPVYVPPSTVSSCLEDAPPTKARQGRQLQRYGDLGERLVAGCLPVKWTSEDIRDSDTARVLLISSTGGKGMVFPKGGWETDESSESAAKRETVEEAGVRGLLEDPMLGIFPFSSKNKARDPSKGHGRCIAHMYVMHVEEELQKWPESSHRERLWCTPAEAVPLLKHAWMRDALNEWVCRQGWNSVADCLAGAPTAVVATSGPTEADADNYRPVVQRA